MKRCKCQGRKIPEQVKRLVRQRCGFGCVMCGLPIIQYHHMIPWSKENTHDPENITLLCDNHHRRVGAGLVPSDEIVRCNSDPCSRKLGECSPEKLYFAGDLQKITLGNNLFQHHSALGTAVIAMIDGFPVLQLHEENGRLLIGFQPFPGLRAMRIERNELILAPEFTDITWIGKRLTIKHERRIVLQIRFDPPNTLDIEQGLFIHNGICLAMSQDGLWCPNINCAISRLEFQFWNVGVAVGVNIPTSAIGWPVPIDHRSRYFGPEQ